MLGTTPAALLSPLDEALRARVIAKTSPGAYRFVHVLVRDVLYRSLSLADRARHHESAGASALEQGAGDDAVLHLERALRELDLLAAATAEVQGADSAVRATALLRFLRKGSAGRSSARRS